MLQNEYQNEILVSFCLLFLIFEEPLNRACPVVSARSFILVYGYGYNALTTESITAQFYYSERNNLNLVLLVRTDTTMLVEDDEIWDPTDFSKWSMSGDPTHLHEMGLDWGTHTAGARLLRVRALLCFVT